MAKRKAVVRGNILSNNGMSLFIPAHLDDIHVGNWSDIDIYAQDTGQMFPLATKLEFADGRLFRYGRFGATSTAAPAARLLYNHNYVPGSAATDGYEGTLDSTSNYAVGSTTLIMNDTTDRAENWYEDGMLAVYPTGHYVEYRILGNDVATSVDDVTIYLEDGLASALTVASTGVTAYPSIFKNMRNDSGSTYNGYVSAVGMFLGPTMTSTYYGWVQRRGRCIITPTAYFGDSANERMAQMHSDGTTAVKAADGTHTIGYLTQRTVSGYGDLEVWLQLE